MHSFHEKRPEKSQWKVLCMHPDYITRRDSHDFSVLAEGVGNKVEVGRNHKWGGGFTGRPELLADLWPSLSANLSTQTLASGVNKRQSLIRFWRFLDAFEDYMAEQGEKIPRVNRLHDVTAYHLNSFSSPGPDSRWEACLGTQASIVRGAIRAAVIDHELPELIVPPISSGTNKRETPPDDSGIAIIRYLRTEALQILQRWRRADELAIEGRNLIELYEGDAEFMRSTEFVATEADAHTTFRALVESTGIGLPRMIDLSRRLGLKVRGLPNWWPIHPVEHEQAGLKVNWHCMMAGLYPTSRDIAIFFLLFIARSAWNVATAASIDINQWSSFYDDEHHWIFAPKFRSAGALQWTVSNDRATTSCYSIVKALLARGSALRRYAQISPGSCSLPDVAVRSPWVGVTPKGGLKPLFVLSPHESRTLNNWLAEIVRSHNSVSEAKATSMSVSDFRDLAAAVMYRESKYSSWVVMVLLGHKNLATTRSYGFRRATFAESFGLIADAVDDVFGQIAEKRVFDIALTRAKLSKMDVSNEDIHRLEQARKNRTYDGAGCADPFNPPLEIDPNNKRDGCSICAQQHRCIASGCFNAFVFSDSIGGLCKRVAELEAIRDSVGVVRFNESSDSADLRILRSTLDQWPQEIVAAEVGRWMDRILRGTHMPIFFAGQQE